MTTQNTDKQFADKYAALDAFITRAEAAALMDAHKSWIGHLIKTGRLVEKKKLILREAVTSFQPQPAGGASRLNVPAENPFAARYDVLDDFIDREEAAGLIGCTRQWAGHLVRSGQLTEKKMLILRAAVEAFEPQLPGGASHRVKRTYPAETAEDAKWTAAGKKARESGGLIDRIPETRKERRERTGTPAKSPKKKSAFDKAVSKQVAKKAARKRAAHK